MTRDELLKVAKPILFNTDMVRAILDDIKGCTRRVVKGFIPGDAVWGYTAFTPKGYISCRGTYEGGYGENFFKLPWQLGDILYVRETWKYYEKAAGCGEAFHIEQRIAYRADENRHEVQKSSEWYEGKWHPSIHMPKEAARIFLKVTGVQVERLQDITEKQAEKEGGINNFGFIHSTDNEYDSIHTAREDFRYNIWNKTIKKTDIDLYGWDANPWVWVIEFERGEAE